MPSLREAQLDVMAAVLGGDLRAAAPLVLGHGIPRERRLAIYRNNCSAGFLGVLAAAFPVILRLGGEPWFQQTVRAFHRRHPSRSGNLHEAARPFPAYLADLLAGTRWHWFGDVARLEWAYQEVLVACEAKPLDLAALARVPPSDYPELVFELMPALRLVESPVPVLAIWQANRTDVSGSRAEASLGDGPARVLVLRKADHVLMRQLSSGLFVLVRALAEGRPLAAAAEAATSAEPGFELGSGLADCFRTGLLAGFRPVS